MAPGNKKTGENWKGGKKEGVLGRHTGDLKRERRRESEKEEERQGKIPGSQKGEGRSGGYSGGQGSKYHDDI